LRGDPSYIVYFTNSTNTFLTNNYLDRGANGYVWVDNADPVVTGNYAWNNGNPTPLTWPF
jgi:parallel beta-helix repeat protein